MKKQITIEFSQEFWDLLSALLPSINEPTKPKTVFLLGLCDSFKNHGIPQEVGGPLLLMETIEVLKEARDIALAMEATKQ